MNVNSLEWFLLVAVIVALFVLDFGVSSRAKGEFTARSATRWIGFYIFVAALFAFVVRARWGGEASLQFVAGYITEYSLSVDNLFVFLVILQSFRVPRATWHRVLLIGITASLLLRAVVILLGVALIDRFIGTFIAFGAFLMWTAWKVAFSESDEEMREGAVIRGLRRVVPISEDFHEHRMTVRIDDRLHLTPLALVMTAISIANLLFAFDSIPAILGLTQSAYIVIAANAFALMGLRQLFFMVMGLLDRLAFLAHGLAVVLAFIGAKLILEAAHDLWWPGAPLVSTGTSLLVIILVLAATAAASLLHEHRTVKE